MLAVGAHLAIATLLDRDALGLIVAAACAVDYRKAPGRAFGMVTTALPTLAGYGLATVVVAMLLWKTLVAIGCIVLTKPYQRMDGTSRRKGG